MPRKRRVFCEEDDEDDKDDEGDEGEERPEPDAESNDPYDILGLKLDATWSDVMKAFRRLIKENHPDKHHGTPTEGDFNDTSKKIIAAKDQILRLLGKQSGSKLKKSKPMDAEQSAEKLRSGLNAMAYKDEHRLASIRAYNRDLHLKNLQKANAHKAKITVFKAAT
jgi:curved DNA-binding protein CbpA